MSSPNLITTLIKSFHSHKKQSALPILVASSVAYAVLRHQRKPTPKSKQSSTSSTSTHNPTQNDLKYLFSKQSDPKQKVAVNKEFWRQLKAVLRICIPSLRSKEIGLIIAHTVFLLLRTWLSVVVAKIDGRIVRDLVAANPKEFIKGLGYWFAIALPATYTNSMLRYFQSKISIAFRTRLTRYVHDLYLNDKLTYYKILNLDSRIESPDQFITTDIGRFCDTVSSLYSNVGKPLIDIIIFNYQLAKHIGVYGMAGLFVNYYITAKLLRAVTPPFGKMAAEEAKLEGDFRAAHSRLITNCEEICFYNGAPREEGILNKAYKALIRHVNNIYRVRVGYAMFEDFLIKYCWSAVGLGVCAVPVFFPEWAGLGDRSTSSSTSTDSGIAIAALGSSNQPELPASVPSVSNKTGSRTQGFITNKRLLISLADAGGRIMYSYKELAELAGFTSRVYNLISILHGLHDDKYYVDPEVGADKPYVLGNLKGMIEYGFEGIQLRNVPVVVPNGSGKEGEVLVEDLCCILPRGQHLMITGPNGVGKTSIARLIRGLWPLFSGHLSKPHDSDIFYIPQKPYLVLGTLRDQIIYPHSHKDMKKAGRTDDQLKQILELVHLAYLPSREGGMDTVKEWKDVFSGGEKQRINLARLFYHHPRFAILDECTSAVSSDVEGLMYAQAKDMGVSLITISHRPSLMKYHTLLLKLTGTTSSYEFTQIGTEEEEMSLEREIKMIEGKLKDMPKWKTRLQEVNRELGIGVKVSSEDSGK